MIRAIAAALLIAAGPALAAEIIVKVENVKNDSGKVAVLLFDDAPGFPNDPAKAARRSQVVAKAGATEVKLTGLKSGRYAVCVIHDANGNQKLDRNFLGIPTEGVAISNGIGRSKPDFKKAVVELKAGETLTLPLKYW